MAAVDEHLVRRGDGLVLLFTPPFDQTPLDPGYIKGYPPGIRENGGQYTHAAIWSVIAFAMLGDGDKAGGAVLAVEPDQSRQHARRRPSLQGRALRRLRRRLRRAAARRARRLDLVHRLGRLDVSGRPRMDPRLPRARRDAASSIPCIPRAGAASRSSSATTRRATRSRSRTRAASAAASTRVELDGAALSGDASADPAGRRRRDASGARRPRMSARSGAE